MASHPPAPQVQPPRFGARRLSALALGLAFLGGLTLAPRAARSQGWDWPEDVSLSPSVCSPEQLQSWKTGQKVNCMGLPTT